MPLPVFFFLRAAQEDTAEVASEVYQATLKEKGGGEDGIARFWEEGLLLVDVLKNCKGTYRYISIVPLETYVCAHVEYYSTYCTTELVRNTLHLVPRPDI